MVLPLLDGAMNLVQKEKRRFAKRFFLYALDLLKDEMKVVFRGILLFLVRKKMRFIQQKAAYIR